MHAIFHRHHARGGRASWPPPGIFFRLSLAVTAALAASGATLRAEAPSYQFEVLPILARKCFACHGPDESHRQADLRLDRAASAVDSGAIVPGDVESSEAFRRITSTDPDEAMPPPEANRQLSPRDIAILRAWIDSGARYEKHWSYEPPTRPAVPAPSNLAWCRNEIDKFILARLDREGMAPEPEADRRRLARRASLDIVGLPPAREDVDAFVADERADAYERFVDRLLESPAYGEHMASKWLDLARYADTAGYEKDSRRAMWAYRDWVIDAFNADMPFDQFTVEQLAGDLLPNATKSQIIATAFHRNTMQNDEGGTDDEEYRALAVIDRVNTTMQVWMGATIGCCQCHSHKYDPFSHREYYQLFAFFNQTADADRFDQEPTIPTPSQRQQRQARQFAEERTRVADRIREEAQRLAPQQREWEALAAEGLAWEPLTPHESADSSQLSVLEDGSFVVTDAADRPEWHTVRFQSSLPTLAAIRLEFLDDDAAKAEARIVDEADAPRVTGLRLLSSAQSTGDDRASGVDRVRFVRIELPDRHDYLALAEVQAFDGERNLAVGARASQSSTMFNGPANLAVDGRTDGAYATGRSVTHTGFDEGPWWEAELADDSRVDRVVVWNRDQFSDRLIGARVSLLDSRRQLLWAQTIAVTPLLNTEMLVEPNPAPPLAVAAASGTDDRAAVLDALRVDVTGDRGWAAGRHGGASAWIAAAPARPWQPASDGGKTAALSIRFGPSTSGAPRSARRFRLWGTSQAPAAAVLAAPARMQRLAATAPSARTPQEQQSVDEFFQATSPELASLREELADLDRRAAELRADRLPVMVELPIAERRVTHVFDRGNFLSPLEAVEPDTPAAFPPFPADQPRNRLGLARWLVDRNNPLTARVAANRLWEQFFGVGLVSTSEDFGSQGSLPSHPELLDWLALRLVDGKWSLKQLARTIAVSATYRQSARTSADKLRRDPGNLLASRGPRVRLSAEQIRDQALAASGLLSRKMHGPSVMPPQPAGVWSVVYSDDRWETSPGPDRYRRAVYTFLRRTSPYPSAVALDATSRERCTIRRVLTNTAVSAITLLNDPAYIEMAQALARRVAERKTLDVAQQAAFAFQLVLGRPPQPAEVERLVALYESELARYEHTPENARKLATVPLGPAPAGMAHAELAAWTVVANALLNLDEALTH